MAQPAGGQRARPPVPPPSEETLLAMRRLVERYPVPRSALMGMLYLVQAEHGYVSEEGIAVCARMLGLTKAEVAAVATFYTMYKREPVGRWLVSVCTQPPCALAGGTKILRRYAEELGIPIGGTTADAAISIEEVECLCACDGAPVLQVNYENYERLTLDQALELLERLRRDDPPPGARGEAPAPSPEVHRRLSGIEGVR